MFLFSSREPCWSFNVILNFTTLWILYSSLFPPISKRQQQRCIYGRYAKCSRTRASHVVVTSNEISWINKTDVSILTLIWCKNEISLRFQFKFISLARFSSVVLCSDEMRQRLKLFKMKQQQQKLSWVERLLKKT